MSDEPFFKLSKYSVRFPFCGQTLVNDSTGQEVVYTELLMSISSLVLFAVGSGIRVSIDSYVVLSAEQSIVEHFDRLRLNLMLTPAIAK